jgi:OFA family oxalate/formate antiporter-like MFS transporter
MFKKESLLNSRWVVLAAGVLIQTILGGLYAWSTFVPSLIDGYGLTKSKCAFIFGLSVAVFAFVTNLSGWVLSRKGPRFTAFIGGVLFSLGYLISSISDGSYLILLLGSGVFVGAGIGFAYVCPLSVSMKWFPKRKGLVTGVSVAGFGGGAVFLSRSAEYFLESGIDVLELFKWIGLLPGAVLILSTCFLLDPPNQKSTVVNPQSFAKAKSWPFLILCLGMFSGTFAGLLVIGNLTPIVLEGGLTASQAVWAVSLFAVGNALGRVTWGWAFDKISYNVIPLSLAVFAALMAALVLSSSSIICLIMAPFMGFCFGGCFVIYAAAISAYFGTLCFSRLYPLCMLGYGVAGLTGPATGGEIADITGSFDGALYLSCGILVGASILTGSGLRFFKKDKSL